MTGWIKMIVAGADEVAAAQKGLLGDPDRKAMHTGGVSIAADLEAVTAMDKMMLMSALGNALQLDKEEWAMLFMLKMGVGPMKERLVAVDTYGVKDVEG
ncbi:MAG: hypothetical protein J6T26_09950 [Firmicutes bacterium]|nr:hypothetical protein [Bacillota bacterium]